VGIAEDIATGMRKKKSNAAASVPGVGSKDDPAADENTDVPDLGGEPGTTDDGAPDKTDETDTGDEGDMGDYDAIETSAVQDLMSTKDPATFKKALRQFVKACMQNEETAEGE
jgi:hypothetical protein